jgi:hypothetical protein
VIRIQGGEGVLDIRSLTDGIAEQEKPANRVCRSVSVPRNQ